MLEYSIHRHLGVCSRYFFATYNDGLILSGTRILSVLSVAVLQQHVAMIEAKPENAALKGQNDGQIDA